jgi:hypothetical protein
LVSFLDRTNLQTTALLAISALFVKISASTYMLVQQLYGYKCEERGLIKLKIHR